MDAARATALAAQYCTAWYAAEEAVRLHDGDHVLIHAAAGGVGTALVQLAKRRGCVVFGTAGSDAKLDLMRQNGVDHPINYRAADFAAEVRRLRGGRGLDAVFDSVGGQTFRKSLPLLEAGGRMVFMGIAQMAGRRPSVFRALKTLVDFGLHSPVTWLKRSQSLIGVNMLQIADRQPEILQRCMQGVMELAGRGEIHP
ncbi:MAG: alcohol dehydrogenase, partial [Nitrospinae bacterium CG11_big_fil_rev_8_21_14_0_20_56_8]